MYRDDWCTVVKSSGPLNVPVKDAHILLVVYLRPFLHGDTCISQNVYEKRDMHQSGLFAALE